MKPVISVLMPVYNAARFLAQAIDSILQQSLKDFEFIIIDDASTDNSVAIIQGYQDSRIRLYCNDKNLGISNTLNRGIDLAETEYIARMDADDISYKNRLEKQYYYCLAHPDIALLSSWARVVDEKGSFIKMEKYQTPYYFYNLNFECWICHPTVVYKRAAVISIGKYTQPYSEDYELFWQLSRKYKIGNIQEPLLDYRVSTTSLHQVAKKKEYDQAQELQVLRNIAYYMGKNYLLSRAEVECLRHNFIPLLHLQSPTAVIKCLRKLNQISLAISATNNINNSQKDLKEAIGHKRFFIREFFARNLKKHQAIIFLIRLGDWKMLYRLSLENLKRILKSKVPRVLQKQ
ncbi:MAG: hypothetical protein NVSMB67_04800 [Flavisolibacter sp.]